MVEIRSMRLKLAHEMQHVIATHLVLCAVLSSALLVRAYNTPALASITANTAIMGERVWAVQNRALFVWHPWVQRAFVASRSMMIGIYVGGALVWGVYAFAQYFQ